MNLVDLAILLILAIMILGGYYRGFIETVCGIFATIISWCVGMLARPLVTNWITGREKLYQTMLYYTEGSEYVAITDVELTRAPISSISLDQLNLILDNADMPIPMDRCITRNIATEAFSAEGITTLGDYFNQTIVLVVINILAVLAIFFVVRLVLGFLIRGVDFARGGFPVLQRADGLIGAGLGLVHGVFVLFVLFMLVPIALTVLPKLYDFLAESFFGEFFYRANFLLRVVPGT